MLCCTIRTVNNINKCIYACECSLWIICICPLFKVEINAKVQEHNYCYNLISSIIT